MSDLEGVLLGDYLLLQRLSKGGVADVYRARRMDEVNTEGGHDVVVKIFRPTHARRETFREHFLSVAEKLGQLEHPHILPCLEYGEGEDLLYLVTPFVSNGTLEDLLRRVGGRFSAMQALPIMQQVCDAIQYVHEQGVVHGNLKPTNIFVGADGRMLVSDFGIARGYDDSQQSLTRVGWGLAEYAAPEQSLGLVKKTSDIYVLGVLLFRILTGVPPFVGHTPVEVLLKHVRQQPPSARVIVSSISDTVDSVMLKAMQKRAEDRFASAQELSDALRAAVTLAPIASPVARMVAPAQPAPSGPLSLKTSALANNVTPDPTTPVPPFVAFSSLSVPVPQQMPAPQADFPPSSQFSPSLFAPPLLHIDSAQQDDDVDITQVRKKSFLHGDMQDDSSLLWSANPAEWSPLAQEGEPSSIPLTASAYLEQTPITILSARNEPQEGRSVAAMAKVDKEDAKWPLQDRQQAVNEEKKQDGQEEVEATQERSLLYRWLPVIVVILLLIGLLGALLSAWFFPPQSQQSGAYLPMMAHVSIVQITSKNDNYTL
jgi:serine/threonine protein kinase